MRGRLTRGTQTRRMKIIINERECQQLSLEGERGLDRALGIRGVQDDLCNV
jgi:hypothetical protein